MNVKTVMLILDAIICAFGGFLIIYFADLEKSHAAVNQMQVTFAQHQKDMEMVAGLKQDYHDAVEKGRQLESKSKEYQRHSAVAQFLFKTANKRNTQLRANLKAAIDKTEHQEKEFHDAAAALEGAEQKIAQLTNENERIVAEKDFVSKEHQAHKQRAAVLESEITRLAAENKALGKLKQTQAREVIGLKGLFQRVATVIDRSGSMELHFEQHKPLFSTWVNYLDFEEFNLITFSDTAKVELWHPTWRDSSNLHRNAAVQYIAKLEASGGTATKAALSKAFELPGIDTIVFFSDGNPTDATPDEILKHVRQLNRHGVVINVVALGDHFEAEYGTFLKQLAVDHGGQFIGL